MKFNFLNIKQRYNLKDYKFSLVALVTAISIIGIFVVGSAQASVQGKQIAGVVLGTVAMIVISLIDYEWVLNMYWLLYGVNIVLLLAVLFFGENINGATRWLNLGFVQFQPSDLTKIITILFFSKFIMEREQAINNKKRLSRRLRSYCLLLFSYTSSQTFQTRSVWQQCSVSCYTWVV